jgi:hypothetical protein
VLLAPLLDVMVFFSELSEALLVSLVLDIEVTCRFAALNTSMKIEVLSLQGNARIKELEENNQDRVIGTFPLFQLQTQHFKLH